MPETERRDTEAGEATMIPAPLTGTGKEKVIVRRAKKPAIVRFWRRAQPGPNCWTWDGAPYNGGYGRMYFNEKVQAAHRVSWQLFRGSIPDGMLVCHHCDNPICVNPAHLFVGTSRDNVLDMVKKDRLGWSCRPRSQCGRGHKFPENLYIPPNGNRTCRACKRIWSKEYKRKRRAMGLPW